MCKWLILLGMVSCGQINVKGGTTNKVDGTTRHEIVLMIDPKLCEYQENQAECLGDLTALLQEFLKTLQQTKELQP